MAGAKCLLETAGPEEVDAAVYEVCPVELSGMMITGVVAAKGVYESQRVL